MKIAIFINVIVFFMCYFFISLAQHTFNLLAWVGNEPVFLWAVISGFTFAITLMIFGLMAIDE